MRDDIHVFIYQHFILHSVSVKLIINMHTKIHISRELSREQTGPHSIRFLLFLLLVLALVVDCESIKAHIQIILIRVIFKVIPVLFKVCKSNKSMSLLGED